MNSLKQLLRQPIRSVICIIALICSGTVLCLSIGLYFSATMTIKETDSIYTTIALPTNRTETKQETFGDTVFSFEQSVITSEIIDWMNGLVDTSPEVKGIYQQRFISAYSKGLQTLVSAMEKDNYSYINDKPYTIAAFVVTIESMTHDMTACTAEVKAKIKDTLLLHNGYMQPEYIHFNYQYFSEDEWENANLEIGGTYLVFGVNYVDQGLTLKKGFAEILKISVNEIDWNNLNYDTEEYVNMLTQHGEDTNNIAALYEYKDRTFTLTLSDLEATTSAWMFVQNPASYLEEGRITTYSDGRVETVTATDEEIKASTLPTITRLATDVVTFLNSSEGTLWNDTFEQYNITNQSVPVLGTDLLESMFEFHQNKSTIISGRSFVQEEYNNGTQVCLISEALALENDLQVGDTIPMAFYQGYDSYLERNYNPPADTYSPVEGYHTDSESFKIIGIYRQSDLWEDTIYTFTPNTIFVPNKSITCEARTDYTGVFYSIVLKNGSIDKMKEYQESFGYNDIFYFYDQGYSVIKDTLTDYLSTTRILSMIGIATWIAMLVLFFMLYVTRLKQTVGKMLSLGAGKKNTLIHILTSTMTLVLIATTISGILGYGCLESIIDYVYNIALTHADINTSFSAGVTSDTYMVKNLTIQKLPQVAAVVTLVQLSLFAFSTWIYGYILVKKKPLTLMKDKEN